MRDRNIELKHAVSGDGQDSRKGNGASGVVVVSRDRTNSANGVFDFAVDTAAFVDTARISVFGEDLSPDPNGLINVKNSPSFSENSGFARHFSGEVRDTGNLIAAVYAKAGKKAPLTAIPDGMVVFRSERTILTGSQLLRDSMNVFPTATRLELSLVEFTFDTSSPGLETIRRQTIHLARRTCSLRDDNGRCTYYIGSKWSAWQIRMYQKTDNICRIEFVFRRPFLVKNNLLRPIDLLRLRGFDLETLVAFRFVSRERLERVAPDRSSKWREGVLRWAERWPISELPAYLRSQGIAPGKVLRRTELQKKIERMQKQFIW